MTVWAQTQRWISRTLVTSMIACSAEPSGPECDAECRQTKIVETWTQDQQHASELLNEISDPIEQIATISRLLDLYPGQVAPLCKTLPEGLTKNRCTTTARRGHLHTARPTPDSSVKASKHTSASIDEFLSHTSEYSQVEADLGECGDHPDLNSCLIDSATQEAKNGDAAKAAALCSSVTLVGEPPTRWRSQCFFEAAMAMVTTLKDGSYPAAVNLCSAAEEYNFECQRHLIGLLTKDVPGADEHAPEVWVQLSKRAELVEEIWNGAPVRDLLVSGVWAISMVRSMERADQISGDVIDQVAPEAIPHLRASAATRLLKDTDPSQHSLNGWVSTLKDRLRIRVNHPARDHKYVTLDLTRESQMRQSAETKGLPLILNQGSARRVLAEDPDADLAICILEAAARLPSVPKTLLEDGLTHPDAGVRETAHQLLLLAKCTGHSDLNACRLDQAIQEATNGNVEQAAALCSSTTLVSNSPIRQRSQCFLKSSMAIMKTLEDQGYPSAVQLCRASQGASSDCQRHLIGFLTMSVPGSDEHSPQAWARLEKRAEIVANVWKDSPVQDRMVSGLWAVSLVRSMLRADRITGDVIDQAPPKAIAHLRAAAATRLLQEADSKQTDLKGWVAALQLRLMDRASHPKRILHSHTNLTLTEGGWPAKNAEDEGMQTTLNQGAAVRVVAEQPTSDLAICILEAAARLQPPSRTLLEDGLNHTDPKVRWTAEQLLAWTAQ